MATPFTAIADGLNALYTGIATLVSYINPLSENFFLRIAFVPQEGYFENYFNDIQQAFESKFPMLTDIGGFFHMITTINYTQELPKFEITLPEKYGGGKYSVVDFNYFVEYRTLILNFIRFSAWFFFIKRLYRKVPDIVYK